MTLVWPAKEATNRKFTEASNDRQGSFRGLLSSSQKLGVFRLEGLRETIHNLYKRANGRHGHEGPPWGFMILRHCRRDLTKSSRQSIIEIDPMG